MTKVSLNSSFPLKHSGYQPRSNMALANLTDGGVVKGPIILPISVSVSKWAVTLSRASLLMNDGAQARPGGGSTTPSRHPDVRFSKTARRAAGSYPMVSSAKRSMLMSVRHGICRLKSLGLIAHGPLPPGKVSRARFGRSFCIGRRSWSDRAVE